MGTDQRADGSQIVQIAHVAANATVHVSIGASAPVRMPLLRAHRPVGTALRSPSRLLRARAGVVPFVDRVGLASGVESWLDLPGPFSAYLVGGRGGSGKTRLGVHLCVEAESHGWVCGLLTAQADPAEVAALAQLPAKRLVVVDYAESRTEQLEIVLPYLAAQATAEHPVRVLLLVRASPRTGQDWTGALRDRRSDELDDILDQTHVQVLDHTPMDTTDRGSLFAVAVTAFADRLAGEQPAASTRPVDLAGDAFASPLMVTVAAYLAVHDPGRSIPDTRSGLLAELAGHENTYWRAASTGSAATASDELRGRIVATATLAGADSDQEAAQILGLLPELSDATAERRFELARWVNGLYPGPRWWNPVEPDLLGEYLVAQHLTDLPGVLAGVLQRDDPAALAQPLDLCARACLDYPALAAAVAAVLDARLGELCQAAITQTRSQPELRLLLGVTTLAAALTRIVGILDLSHDSLSAVSDLFPVGANQLLGPLSLAVASRLVGIRRRLAAANPAAYEPALAMSLNNWSVRLGESGRRDEGLAAIEEAVEIRRRLAAANPAAYEPDLAMSLNNWSIRLGEAGRRDESLAAIEEAVEVYRRLAAANPAAYEPDLASSLNNWSIRLAEAGRRDEGLAAIEEAVEVYRRLAAANPAAYEPDLATSLNNWSIDLAEAGRRDEGLAAIEEANNLTNLPSR